MPEIVITYLCNQFPNFMFPTATNNVYLSSALFVSSWILEFFVCMQYAK